ncbi:MAG: immunoglobulin domain-containing protein [Planctomycetota bacterium]
MATSGQPLDTEVQTATYLSSSSDSTIVAADIAPSGSVVLGGVFAGSTQDELPLPVPETLLGGGGGSAIIRLSADGRVALSLSSLPAGWGDLRDLQVHPLDGTIAVMTENTVAIVSADGSSIVWSDASLAGEGLRVAIAADGTLAYLLDGPTDTKLVVLDGAQTFMGSASLPFTIDGDVAVDAATESVVVVGSDQASPTLRTTFAISMSYDAQTTNFQPYTWNSAELTGVGATADARLVRAVFGRDGQLYLLGESTGGNSLFNRDPLDLNTPVSNVLTDSYDQTSNLSSRDITYVTRLDPATGAFGTGKFLLGRLSSSAGNTLRPLDIAADEIGRVHVAGLAGFGLPNRNAPPTINGSPVGAYAGLDPWIYVMEPDFATRLVWTPPIGSGGQGSVTAVAAGAGTNVFAGSLSSGLIFGTPGGLQTAPGKVPSSGNRAAFAIVQVGSDFTQPLSIDLQPATVAVDEGDEAKLEVSVTGGTPPYSYFWHFDGEPIEELNGPVFFGATSSTLTVSPAGPSVFNGGVFDVVVTDDQGAVVTSDAAQILVNRQFTTDLNSDGVTDFFDTLRFLEAVDDGG